MSDSYSFDKENAMRVLRVFAWSMASVIVTLAIGMVTGLQLPTEYAWAIPLVNSALYALKEYIEDQRV